MADGAGQTNINRDEVIQFSKNAEGIRTHMQAVLRQTDASVQDAISPATWGGQASAAFGDVTARYQSASVKLNRDMDEILNSVNKTANTLQNSDESNAHNVSSAGSGSTLNYG